MTSTTVERASQISEPTVELSPMGKRAIWVSIVAVLFLGQVAYNIGEFPLAGDLVSYGMFTAYLLVSGYAAVSVPSLFIFACFVALAAIRIPFAESATSWSSFLLLCTLYAPFIFRLVERADLQPTQNYILNAFVTGASIIAGVAILQIVLVNALKLSALANIYFVLPTAIRGAGTYTFLREGGGGIVKANGFFLRESADLSFVTALALLIEYRLRKRLHILVLLGAALLFSMSGSGVIALIAGLLLPRSLGRVPAFVAYTAGFVLLLVVLYSLDNPLLNIWFGRLSEFSTPNTSAYARFIAPMQMVQLGFEKGFFTTWLGNGAGSYFRDLSIGRFGYEVADPTWAKLTYEYGLAGSVLVLTLLIVRLYSSSLRMELCNFLMFGWISLAFVLKPGYALIIWLLTLVPPARSRSSADP
ncbi:hypothetical protein [Bradyrhizobium sp. RT5a]|uniref:hypothetical protein n=1 Tax=Bradyrhizobium sp. RT5a TaxID=3156380 RepID=UPI0033991272